jgi:TnpA family transposase
MPVNFLTPSQRESFGRYSGNPSPESLERFFYLSDADHELIAPKHGEHNRLGFALQLTTVRFLGAFLDEPAKAPPVVIDTVCSQLKIGDSSCLASYERQRWEHIAEISAREGFKSFSDPLVGFRLARWLYAQCWTGTERPGALFERATSWLLANKVLLPGASALERFVSRLRQRVEERVCQLLGKSISEEELGRLDSLLRVPKGNRSSVLDQLRSGPVMVSVPALIHALERLQRVRELGIQPSGISLIPPSRIASLARIANTAKATAVANLPPARRMATLVAFVHTLEASALDDALEVFEALVHDLFGSAKKADQKARLRNLKDLDAAATTLAEAFALVLDETIPDENLRAALFAHTPRQDLAQALGDVGALVRPPDDVFYRALEVSYRRVRRFLPILLEHVSFIAAPAGECVVEAYNYLRDCAQGRGRGRTPPLTVVTKPWERHVLPEDGGFDDRAYEFCILDRLRDALRRRDIFVTPSWRYADPRNRLLAGSEWEAARPIICRSLGYTADPGPVLAAPAEELDHTYRRVASRLPDNPAVTIERVDGKDELCLSALDKLDDPPSLTALRNEVEGRMPQAEVPEIILEIAIRTGFTKAFTHISDRNARAEDIMISLCAALLGEAMNTGIEPLVSNEIPALRRDRLSWVGQNYLRGETIAPGNAALVAEQSGIELAQMWGGGDVASADGMRFVVPVRTIHAGPNPKYYGFEKGATWYNMMSDQFTGLGGIVVPGTLRDSLVLLAVVLEQQTELQPTQIITDHGAYSDIVFGLFRLLGFYFSPRLADMGGARFWRFDPKADYGALNSIARHRIRPQLIVPQWDDMLRLAGSLKMGRVPATGIMRTLQVGDRQTALANAIAEFGRIDKTRHMLTLIDDESSRRSILVQLNRHEGRHRLARAIFHGKRGELRKRYREGQEDQLGALGLVVNIIVLWNTIYMNAVLQQLRKEGYPVKDEDAARLSPTIHKHINMMGKYPFVMPESVARGELRPLRNPLNNYSKP